MKGKEPENNRGLQSIFYYYCCLITLFDNIIITVVGVVMKAKGNSVALGKI